MSARTVLLGLSGATPRLMTLLRRDGRMPFLTEWMASGVFAGLSFPAPITDAAAWTSLITGRSPVHHGILDLFRRELAGGHKLRALNSRDVACEPVWGHLQREGKRSTILEWPLTLPPPRVDGHVIPGSWATSRQLRFGCHPSDLPRRLAGCGLGKIDDFLMSSAPPDPVERGAAVSWIEAQAQREMHVLGTLRHLALSEPSHLSLAILRSFGTVGVWYTQYDDLRAAAASYLEALERSIAALIQACGPETNFLMASEPGSRMSRGTFPVNAWLQERGDLAWAEAGAPAEPDLKVLDTDQLNRHSQRIDWSRTRAWRPLAAKGEIHILRRDAAHPQGVTGEEYGSYRRRLADDLSRAGEVERVWTREELYPGALHDFGPDLIVQPAPEGGAGGFFFARGPLFKPRAALGTVSLLEVAPLICYSLDIPIPAEMEGRPPVEAIDEEQLQSLPIRIGSVAAERPAEERVLDPRAEEEILQRLRSLGYVE